MIEINWCIPPVHLFEFDPRFKNVSGGSLAAKITV